MSDILKRLKSPVLWLGILGLIYSVVLVPNIDSLPEWTTVAGYLCTIFGIANNPSDRENF